MGLSFEKLREFIHSQKFVITKAFMFEKRLFMMEIVSIEKNSNFFLYIPSKYKFENVSGGIKSYHLQYLDIEKRKTVDEYTKGINQEDVEDVYGDEEIEITPGDNVDMEEHLEDKYKKNITVKDITKNDLKDINAVYRQVKRLGYSVYNISYKICIIYGSVLCSIRGTNDIETFMIKHYYKNSKKRLYILVNLEKFFDNKERIPTDVDTVKGAVHKLMEKNQKSTLFAMQSILENKDKLINSTGLEVDDLNEKLARIYKVINGINTKERDLLEELARLAKEGVGTNETSLRRSKISDELGNIASIREESMGVYIELEEKKDNWLLSIDKVLFDNTVMLNGILKNFETLGAIQ